MTQPLAGLNGLAGMPDRKKLEEDAAHSSVSRYAKMKEEAMVVQKSGDPNKIAEFSIANPEIAQAMSVSTGFKTLEESDNYRDALLNFYTDPNIESANLIEENRQGVMGVASQGEDSFVNSFYSSKDNAVSSVAIELALRYPNEWKSLPGGGI